MTKKPKAPKKVKVKVNRSAKSGEFVDQHEVEHHPATTVTQTVEKVSRKAGG